MVPAICSRNLQDNDNGLFTVIEHSFSETARVDISVNLRDAFLVHYVYGFYHHDFAYFALIQRKSYLLANQEWGHESR